MDIKPVERLAISINQVKNLLSENHSEDADKLILETRQLAKIFKTRTDAQGAVYYLASIVVTTFAEASISVANGDEWRSCLTTCRWARTELRRLQPYESDAMKILWAVGRKAEEMMIMGVRINTSKNRVGQEPKGLRNDSIAEALAGYFDCSIAVPASANREKEQREIVLSGPMGEAQYLSAALHWSFTGAR